MIERPPNSKYFFFNDSATTAIYTPSLHDALPISALHLRPRPLRRRRRARLQEPARSRTRLDRKSTRLNSSHGSISYAVFCLKKKNKNFTHLYIKKKKKKNTNI